MPSTSNSSSVYTTPPSPAVIGSAAVGAVTFPVVLAASQTSIFKPLGLTYKQGNRVLSVYGGLTVCVAGFTATLATLKTLSIIQSAYSTPGTKINTDAITGTDVLVSTISSAVVFRALGGRFSAVLPSHLLRPGAFAREWLPASKGPQYASEKEREVIQTFGRKYGCHSCGKKRVTNFVCDHQPPTKCLLQDKPNSSLSFLQRFYPQCNNCSLLQGGLLKTNGNVTASLKTIRTHPFSLRLYHTFLPLPLALAYFKNYVGETRETVATSTEESESKTLTKKEEAVRTIPTTEPQSSKRTIHTLIGNSDINELVSNFPLLIVWQKLVGFLDSFKNPGDAFHVTLWSFLIIAAWGTM